MDDNEMTIADWLTAKAKNEPGKGADWPYEARRSAVIYGAAAAILACNYKVSAAEARDLMLQGFEHELERRRGLDIEFEP